MKRTFGCSREVTADGDFPGGVYIHFWLGNVRTLDVNLALLSREGESRRQLSTQYGGQRLVLPHRRRQNLKLPEAALSLDWNT
jgi:hypothetical protein